MEVPGNPGALPIDCLDPLLGDLSIINHTTPAKESADHRQCHQTTGNQHGSPLPKSGLNPELQSRRRFVSPAGGIVPGANLEFIGPWTKCRIDGFPIRFGIPRSLPLKRY